MHFRVRALLPAWSRGGFLFVLSFSSCSFIVFSVLLPLPRMVLLPRVGMILCSWLSHQWYKRTRRCSCFTRYFHICSSNLVLLVICPLLSVWISLKHGFPTQLPTEFCFEYQVNSFSKLGWHSHLKLTEAHHWSFKCNQLPSYVSICHYPKL